MDVNSKYYPFALLTIIVGAIYFVAGDLGKPDNVDLSKYMTVCKKYEAAAAGQVSRDELQMMVYQVNYLLPSPVKELTDPVEKALKVCAQNLNKRLARSRGQNT